MDLGWHLNRFMCRNLWLLHAAGARLTITNLFRSPGDTLLTGTVCRVIKERYPRIRINCRVNHPELLRENPAISTFNEPAGRWRIDFEYLALLEHRDATTNVLAPTLAKVGIRDYSYKARVFLTAEEIQNARALLGPLERPVLTLNVMSREAVKIWPLAKWKALVAQLAKEFTIVQLGDATEPHFDEVISLAGKLSLRESMAVLSQAKAHVGPDSFLMHAANGLDVPGVIIFGGSRTDKNLGYAENQNLYRQVECGPCWIHTSKGERCAHSLKCMDLITPDEVLAAIHKVCSPAFRRSSA